MKNLWWSLVLIAGVALIVHESGSGPDVSADGAGTQVAYLLETPVRELVALEVTEQGHTVRVERRTATDGDWAQADHDHDGHDHHDHHHDHVDDAMAAAAIAEHVRMFGVARIERALPAPGDEGLAAWGLAAGQFAVRTFVAGDDEPRQTFRFGDTTPDSFGCYVLIEPGHRLVTIASYQADNLKALGHTH